MAKRLQTGLHRDVDSSAIAGAIYGNVASAGFVALGIVAASALGLTPLVFVVAGLVFLLTILSYLEGISMIGEAGGSSSFARVAFNDFMSFFAGWALALDYIITIAIAAFFATHYLASIDQFASVGHQPWDVVAAIVMVGGAALVNLQGSAVWGRLSVVVAFVALALQITLVALGLLAVLRPTALVQPVHLGVAPTWNQLWFSLPVAMIGFGGIEIAANLSEEIRDPARELVRPMLISAVVAVGMLVSMSVLGLAAMPVHLDHGAYVTDLGRFIGANGHETNPLIGIVENIEVLSSMVVFIEVAVVVLAMMVLFVMASNSMTGLSRLAFSMARHRQVPSFFGRIEREAGAPVIAVIQFAIAACIALVVTTAVAHSAMFLAQLYAFGALLSFAIAHAAIITLRITDPERERDYRAPLNVRIAGRSLPVTAILGLLGTVALWIACVATHMAALAVGVIWMVSGFVAYATYRLVQGQSLIRAERWQYEERVVDVGTPSWESVLMAINPGARVARAGDDVAADLAAAQAVDGELVALAGKLLRSESHTDQRAAMPGEDTAPPLTLLVVHEIPLTKPLGAKIGVAEESATRRLSAIRRVADRIDLPMASTVAKARAAGRAICQEAERRHSDVVLMACVPRRRPNDPPVGRTVEYVLRNAPCAVAVLRFPDPVPPRRGNG